MRWRYSLLLYENKGMLNMRNDQYTTIIMVQGLNDKNQNSHYNGIKVYEILLYLCL